MTFLFGFDFGVCTFTPDDDEPEPEPEVVPSAPLKGLLSVPKLACVRSKSNCKLPSWNDILSDRLVEASEDPAFQAPIHWALVSATPSVPPDQLSQFAHRTLAIIESPDTPLPESSSRSDAVEASYCGSAWRLDCRDDTVTLPFPSWYIRKMFAPTMLAPVPKATHW